MPVINTLGSLTYAKNLFDSYPLGNAYIGYIEQQNNISLSGTSQIITPADIQVINNDCIFAFGNDTWNIGTCLKLNQNATPTLGFSGQVSGSFNYVLSSGFFSGSTLYSVGYEERLVGSNYDPRIYISAINTSGGLSWRNNYYTSTGTDADLAIGVKARGGGLYIIGSVGIASPLGSAFLSRIGGDGSVVWSRSMNLGSTVDYAINFDIDQNNNIFVVCRNTAAPIKYYIVKFDSNGTQLAGRILTSGIVNGIKCDNTDVYVSIDDGFIKFDTDLNIVLQKRPVVLGTDTGLSQLSTIARKIDVDPITKNIFLCIPRRTGGIHYIYINCIDSSNNLLYQNRISIANYSLSYQTNPIISGIKYNNNRIFIVYRSQDIGSNNMNVLCLPSDGTIPLNGIYSIGAYRFRYEQIIKNGSTVDTTYTTTSGISFGSFTLNVQTSNTGNGTTTPIGLSSKKLL